MNADNQKTQGPTILGYDRKGEAIHPPRPGQITTQAFILCGSCNTAIRSTGGPRHGSVCPVCASKGLFTTQEQAEKLAHLVQQPSQEG